MKNMRRPFVVLSGIALMLAIAGSALARAEQPSEQSWEKMPPPQKMEWVGAEMRFSGRTVQGQPYSAQGVTEFTQVLADGNRITRKSTTYLYRDGEGRTRREQRRDGNAAAGASGPAKFAGAPFMGMMRSNYVVITDPVAGVEHVLDPEHRTAQTRKFSPLPEKHGTSEAAQPRLEWMPKTRSENTRSESLGRQVIDGIDAEGTRTVTTIPAGAMGNERALEVVSERWYSPELQIIVRSRHSDPLSGETVYRLTNVGRAEPQRSLFEVPSDYNVRSSGPEVKRRGPRE
jgi:hypothetical protein